MICIICTSSGARADDVGPCGLSVPSDDVCPCGFSTTGSAASSMSEEESAKEMSGRLGAVVAAVLLSVAGAGVEAGGGAWSCSLSLSVTKVMFSMSVI